MFTTAKADKVKLFQPLDLKFLLTVFLIFFQFESTLTSRCVECAQKSSGSVAAHSLSATTSNRCSYRASGSFIATARWDTWSEQGSSGEPQSRTGSRRGHIAKICIWSGWGGGPERWSGPVGEGLEDFWEEKKRKKEKSSCLYETLATLDAGPRPADGQWNYATALSFGKCGGLRIKEKKR